MIDPKRILDRAANGSLERLLLESGRNPGPSRAQRDATWARLSARLGPSSPAASSTTASGASGLLVQGAAVAALVVTLGAGFAGAGASGAGFIAPRVAAPLPARALVNEAAPPPAPEALPRPTESATAVSAPASVVARPVAPAAVPHAERRAHPAARHDAPQSSPAPASPLEEESALVGAARDAVRGGNCRAALDTLAAASERFSRGILGQEREALRITALGCSGNAPAAADAAAEFLRAYPDSPHAASVQRWARTPARP
jgi:hypothetical protein